jgi:hypothetical protein
MEGVVMPRRRSHSPVRGHGTSTTGRKADAARSSTSTKQASAAPQAISRAGNSATNTAINAFSSTPTTATFSTARSGFQASQPFGQQSFTDRNQIGARQQFQTLQPFGRQSDPYLAASQQFQTADLSEHAPNPLLFADTKQPVTPDRLINWAAERSGSPRELSRNILSSYDFIGDSSARDSAVRMLDSLSGAIESVRSKKRAEQAAQAAEVKKQEDEAYQRVGTARAPFPNTLITTDELQQQQQRDPSFSKPVDYWYGNAHATFVKGQVVNGYTVVSPQAGIVQKDGYYYKLGQADLYTLYAGYHYSQSPVVAREVYENSRGVNVAIGLAMQTAGRIASYLPGPVARVAAPFVRTLGEQVLYDDAAIEARTRGETLNEPRPDIGADTAVEAFAGLAGEYAGAGVGKLSPWLGKATPVAAAVASRQAQQTVEKTYAYTQGQASVSNIFRPDYGVTDIATDLVTGKLIDKAYQALGPRVPKASTPETTGKPPTHEVTGAVNPQTDETPKSGKGLPAPDEAGDIDWDWVTRSAGQEPPGERPPSQAPGEGHDPHLELYKNIIAMRGHDAAPGVGQHAELATHYEQLKSTLPPDIKPEGKGDPNAEWQKLKSDMEWERKKLQGEATALGKEVRRLSEMAKRRAKNGNTLSAEDQGRLEDLSAKLKEARQQRDSFKELEQDIKQTRNKLAVARFDHPDRRKDPAVQSKGGALGKFHDTFVAIQIIKTQTPAEIAAGKEPEVLATVYEKFDSKAAQEAKRNRGKADPRHPDELHAEEKGLPNLTRQLALLKVSDARGGQDLTKDLSGYTIEVVGDREVCKKYCGPLLHDFAQKTNADSVKGYTYAGETAEGKKFGDKQAAVLSATDAAEGLKLTKQTLDIYDRNNPPAGDAGGGGEGHGHAQEPTAKKKTRTAKRTPRPRAQQKGAPTETGIPAKPAARRAAPRRKPGAAAAGAPPTVESEVQKTSSGPLPDAPANTEEEHRASPRRTRSSTKPRALEGMKQQVESSPTPSEQAKLNLPAPQHPDTKTQKGEEPRRLQQRPETEGTSAKTADQTPGRTKADAQHAVPDHAQPVASQASADTPKNKSNAPEHPPSSKGERIAGALGKADTVLSAVRDYQQYKAEGKSETHALVRSGVTLAANLKGGPAAGVVNAANAYDNARRTGQGKLEATATALGTAGGGVIASKIAPTGPVGTAVNLANTAAQALGAPQGVQDATQGAANLVPSNIVSTTITEGARSYANLGTALVTGDTKALDKQVQGMQAGNAGPWLQGYAQMTGMAADLAAGDSFEKALNKAADSGRGSWADRVGSKGGDGLYELGQSKDAKAGKYGSSVQGISMALGMGSDMIAGKSFEQALNSAADAGRGTWPEKAGNALGDAAWDAKEKVKQLVGTDLPAAKQLIKNQWHKLWD